VGSSFRLYFPLVPQPLTAAAAAPGSAGSLRGTETVLVVEDADPVRRLMVTALAQQGYTVLFAADGDEALRAIGQQAGPLHLLITDIVLPRRGGPEIAGELTRARPGLKVLYTSGYAERGMVENGALEPGAEFLQKPFVPDALARKVREVLDRVRPQG
jgi:DNA-binding NtrC family response regulator